MISRGLAAELRKAGLAWRPATGDWYDGGAAAPELVDSHTTVESVAASGALWLPREDQLREVLGEAFIGLEHIPGETPGYVVSTLIGDTEHRFVDVDVATAYARAAVALLKAAR